MDREDTAHLRAVVTGLLGFAASEEEMFLVNAGGETEESGNERLWAAVPTVAHNTEFKAQQADRLTAVLTGCTPPSFGDIDHTSHRGVRGLRRAPGPGGDV